ncbi:hypothetical protein HDV06_001666 [Boothiomyces sp. JEL0866]|nr:hypothetical protein HDV06_001666 [Boothiomyces sp. JEL0866]
MNFFNCSKALDLNLVDANHQRVVPKIYVNPKKGIWYKNGQWNTYKRNQFHISVSVQSPAAYLLLNGSPVLMYKLEISCTDVLDSSKFKVQQKTKSGMTRVQPVYIPVDSKCAIVIPKLQFNRSTPSQKHQFRNDSFLQLIVNVSAVTMDESEYPLATFTSENLNVLSGTPSQYSDEVGKVRGKAHLILKERQNLFNAPPINLSLLETTHKIDLSLHNPAISHYNDRSFTNYHSSSSFDCLVKEVLAQQF